MIKKFLSNLVILSKTFYRIPFLVSYWKTTDYYYYDDRLFKIIKRFFKDSNWFIDKIFRNFLLLSDKIVESKLPYFRSLGTRQYIVGKKKDANNSLN